MVVEHGHAQIKPANCKVQESHIGQGETKIKIAFEVTQEIKELVLFFRTSAVPTTIFVIGPHGNPLGREVLRDAGPNYAEIKISAVSPGTFAVEVYPDDCVHPIRAKPGPNGNIRNAEVNLPGVVTSVKVDWVFLSKSESSTKEALQKLEK